MKNAMKRIVSIALILAALCAFLVPGAMAADSVADIQKAVVETAMAYYNKGEYVQYDSTQLSAQSRLTHGESRTTSGRAPEWASADETLYSVCSDFVFTVYYDALGIEICGGSRNAITQKMALNLDPAEPTLVFYYGGLSDNKDPASIVAAEKLLQPGDIITYSRKDNTGHATLYVGDVNGDGKGDIMHCNGKKIDLKTGIDTKDDERNGNGGAIRIDSAESLVFGENSLEKKDNFVAFTIMRPSKLGNLTITDAAKTRMQYRGIEVDRTASIHHYNSAVIGSDVKVSVQIINNGTEAYKGLPVKEVLPVGATIKADSITGGGQLTADGIQWTVDVEPGKDVTLTYSVTVTAGLGDTLVLPSGRVGGLVSRPMEFSVSGQPFGDAALNMFTLTRKGRFDDALKNLNYDGDLDFVNAFYREVLGIELGLPKTIQEVVDNMHTPTRIDGVSNGAWGGQMLVPKSLGEMSATYQRLDAMMIPEHKAGWAVYTRESLTEVPPMTTANNRVIEMMECFYQPGDIFFGYVHKDGKSFTVYEPDVFIYLGSRKVIGWSYGTGEVEIDSFANTIGQLMREDVLFALRPTLLYNDINTAKKANFTDVKASDWYGPYVSDLVADGTVSGMTATTYAPSGTLTWGQALKLITVALGRGEQPATGHWASGYMAYAKNNGWLSADVNLDAPISRLQFCQVAAKAAGLTEQPAANPFTDCSDADVLALVNAGIINGMTATTFQPDATLTRAQIAKIIWLLTKV